jgi:hypothetical protein
LGNKRKGEGKKTNQKERVGGNPRKEEKTLGYPSFTKTVP